MYKRYRGVSFIGQRRRFKKVGMRLRRRAACRIGLEHGGGNNSTFTNHVVTSSGTDTYSTVVSSLASLKGPRHGGANIKVSQMFEDIKAHVKDWDNEEELTAYLDDILHKKHLTIPDWYMEWDMRFIHCLTLVP